MVSKHMHRSDSGRGKLQSFCTDEPMPAEHEYPLYRHLKTRPFSLNPKTLKPIPYTFNLPTPKHAFIEIYRQGHADFRLVVGLYVAGLGFRA